MAIREERTMELNVLYANDLEKVTTFGKQNCFVVAYISPLQKESTPVDRVGGRNPSWNSKLILTCDESIIRKPASYIMVEIYTHSKIINKLVGSVTIPLQDGPWSARSGNIGKPQVMAYHVRRRSGRVQGTLNIAVKLGGKKTISTLPPPRCYGPKQIGNDLGYGGSQRFIGYESSQLHNNAYGGSQHFSGFEATHKYPKEFEGQGRWRSSSVPQY